MRVDLQVPLPVTGMRLSLWRAATVFRLTALAICLFLIVLWQPIYARPEIALLAGAGMLVVTAILAALAWRGLAHRARFVLVDVVATAGLTLLSIPAQTFPQQHGSMVTLTTLWAAGPTIEAAFLAGPLGGLVAGLLQYGVAAVVADDWHGRTLYSGVLLIVTGVVVGFVTQFATRAEDELRIAAATQAATVERERLARSIHDGVLQVLALVHRTGSGAGGQWAMLATAAAEQEAALRGLITSRPPSVVATGRCDLAEELRSLGTRRVTVSVPAEPVAVAAARAAELGDAVRAALHNVAVHAGEGVHAWVLLDALDDELRVTVRDDGAGMSAGRLDAAAREGRLGVAHSIRGRVTDLGGRCRISSTPGNGTELEIVIPR